jgi:hypothetical protein
VGIAPELLNQEQRFEIRRQARIEWAKRCASRGDILAWGKVLFPDKFSLPFCNELHNYFVGIRKEEYTNTEAPREHAKTTIKCFLIPIFQALNEPKVFRHYLNVQATTSKSITVNTAIKVELETNELIREIYGEQVGLVKWTDKQFVLRNGVVFTAVGAGESIRGMNYRNIRPDYIIVDDLYDDDDINNIESTKKKTDWFWSSLFKARAQTRKCSIHVQGTAINSEDLLEKLKSMDRWFSKTFRAIKNMDSKEVLWPELNTFDSLMQDLDEMGSVIFYREMQNERRDEASAIVKTAWLTGWEYDPAELAGRFSDHFKLVSVVMGVDPSIGEKVINDYTGAAVMLKCKYEDSTGFVYFIDGLWNQHLSLDQRVLLLDRIYRDRIADGKPPITRANIESIAGFKDFAAEVVRRTALPVRVVDKVPDKISNLENKSKYFENKKVFINKTIAKNLKDVLYYQLTTNYPNHDDLRDAVLLCLDDVKREPSVTVF